VKIGLTKKKKKKKSKQVRFFKDLWTLKLSMNVNNETFN
jgi:hypothetical protein